MLANELSKVRVLAQDNIHFCVDTICTTIATEMYECLIPARAIDPFAPKDQTLTVQFGLCQRHYFARPKYFKYAIDLSKMPIEILPMETIEGCEGSEGCEDATLIEDAEIIPAIPAIPAITSAVSKPIAYISQSDGSAIVAGRALAEMRNGFDRPLTIDEMCTAPRCELAHLPDSTLCPLHNSERDWTDSEVNTHLCENAQCEKLHAKDSYFCADHFGQCPPDGKYAADLERWIAIREREAQNPMTNSRTAFAEPTTIEEVTKAMAQTRTKRRKRTPAQTFKQSSDFTF